MGARRKAALSLGQNGEGTRSAILKANWSPMMISADVLVGSVSTSR
jgi:hypothetical protein